jgi:hypothetical protein
MRELSFQRPPFPPEIVCHSIRPYAGITPSVRAVKEALVVIR